MFKIAAYNFLFTIKAFGKYILALILAILLPIIPLILLVGLCIMLDTFSGVYRTYKQKKKITSRGFSALISKMLLYQGTLILFFLIDNYVLNELVMQFTVVSLFLTKFVAIILVGVEVFSILENIKLSTGYDFIKMAKNMVSRGKTIKEDVGEFIEK